jgi:predicted pyridoxine 5'-phosphate oxidase superfamily flavin-nucleotide-binding protein
MRHFIQRLTQPGETFHELGEDEIDWLAERDHFYMATVSETGWPYIQHRGGPPGFVKALDERTLAFADFRGNRQYLTVGNLAIADRASLIFVDYPTRARLKLLVHATTTQDPEVLAKVALPDYKAVVERAMVLRVEAFDWNCPQHITPRYTLAELGIEEPHAARR